MKKIKADFVSKTMAVSQKLDKKFQEDEKNKSPQKSPQKVKQEEKVDKGRFGTKALRKILRKLGVEFDKDEMKSMIWVKLSLTIGS
jgi:hypothetical protein